MIVKTLHKTAWLTAGALFLLLAIIGVLLPVIPQLPFFIASTFCFMRCSDRFRDWVQNQHWFERIRKHLPHHKKHDSSSID